MGRILIVDDEIDVINIIKYAVQRDGHQLLEARNGQEGLDIVAKERPDLIVLDIMMPEMDGLMFSRRLMANPSTKDIPVIVLSAKGRIKDELATIPNIRSYMEKPFEPVVLQEKIRSILAGTKTN